MTEWEAEIYVGLLAVLARCSRCEGWSTVCAEYC